MAATFTYRLQASSTGYFAECCEMEVAAVGRSPTEAVEGLKAALRDRLSEPNAVAPPSSGSSTEVSLTEAPRDAAPAPSGPGAQDSPHE
jgi:predicted RNase H-like HicB family nuclease